MRDEILALPAKRLVLRDDENFNPSRFNFVRGGSWAIEGEIGGFSLSLPLLLPLRSATNPDNVREQLVFETELMLPDRTSINICVTRWEEEVTNSIPMLFLHGLSPPVARRSHIAIEQIDYGDHRQGSLGLSRDELEIVASFIRPAVRQMLNADITFLSRKTVAGRPVPATGELIERWRKPRPELAELHAHLDAFRRSFPERLNTQELGRYSFVKEGLSTYALVDGEPDVRIGMPSWGPENFNYSYAKVEVAGVRCHIDVCNLNSRTLDPPVEDRGQIVKRVGSYGIVDPFSLRLRPVSGRPFSLSPTDAARVVRHMRNVYPLRSNTTSRQYSSFQSSRLDAVVL